MSGSSFNAFITFNHLHKTRTAEPIREAIDGLALDVAYPPSKGRWTFIVECGADDLQSILEATARIGQYETKVTMEER